MARVLTNTVSLRFAIESSIGVLPGANNFWRTLEPNTITKDGSTITTVARRPITPIRARRKGIVTDLNSGLDYEGDLTMQLIEDFAEGFMFSEYANVEFLLFSNVLGTPYVPPPATSNAYTIAAASNGSGGANGNLAGKVQVSTGVASLLYAKGYAIAANNGLKFVTTDLTSGQTTIVCTGQGVVAETPPVNASLQVCGVRVDDLTLTISGSTATLVSGGHLASWSSLGIQVGQFIHIGSDDGTGHVQNAFSSNAVYGYARVTSMVGSTLNLDKIDSHLVGGPFGPASADVLFGRFSRNVPIDAVADDKRYLERSYQFETTYLGLGGAGVPQYEYVIGNFANQLAFNIPLTNKATVKVGFLGTTAEPITATRKTNASAGIDPNRIVGFSTSGDIASISTDLTSLASNIAFKSLTLTLDNHETAEKAVGTLGALFINSGLFTFDLAGQMIFMDKAIIDAIRNNTTVTLTTILKNQDGALALDMPTMTFNDGTRVFPLDQSVLVNVKGETFRSPVFLYDLGMSLFANVPTFRL